jgi:type III pantothenate kinase
MSPTSSFPLVAVDVGNSRVKLARFDEPPPLTNRATLPTPTAVLDVDPRVAPGAADPWDDLTKLVGDRPCDAFTWHIGSVQRQTSARLVEHLRDRGATRVTLLAAGDLPIYVNLPRPDMVGIDRLLGAVAANQLRSLTRPAIVVDLGSAITVDLVSTDGAFQGGAILPGLGMSARAMHHFTDLLPLVEMQTLAEPPPAVGTATVAAMTSGLFWGAVGGVRQLIELMGREGGGDPEVFLTGGAAPSVASLLPGSARFEANLVPAGIALAAAAASVRS